MQNFKINYFIVFLGVSYVSRICNDQSLSVGIVRDGGDTGGDAGGVTFNVAMGMYHTFNGNIRDDDQNDVEKFNKFYKSDIYCLKNLPLKLFGSPSCGNGFLEVGEECDCGSPSECKNSCCDANTCKLRPNAVCASGKCCDLTTCRPIAPGLECRAAVNECDSPEYCDGYSGSCPVDHVIHDHEECADRKVCLNQRCMPSTKLRAGNF